MIKAVQLTPTSWILNENGLRVGLVTQNNQNHLNVFNNTIKGTYDGWEKIEAAINKKIEIVVPELETPDQTTLVNNLPIKHSSAFNIDTLEIKNTKIHSYTKTANSDIKFAAGYFGVLFENGKYVASFCPKLTTLIEHGFIGPYNTKLEMQNSINQKHNAPAF